FMNQVGGTACQFDFRARFDAVKYFIGRWPRSFTFQNFLNVVGQGLASRLRPARQFSVQAVRDISFLDHLRHVLSMSHAARMFKPRSSGFFVGAAQSPGASGISIRGNAQSILTTHSSTVLRIMLDSLAIKP